MIGGVSYLSLRRLPGAFHAQGVPVCGLDQSSPSRLLWILAARLILNDRRPGIGGPTSGPLDTNVDLISLRSDMLAGGDVSILPRPGMQLGDDGWTRQNGR